MKQEVKVASVKGPYDMIMLSHKDVMQLLEKGSLHCFVGSSQREVVLWLNTRTKREKS